MNPWAILDIEPCDDPRAIKRAYAVKLKQNRPDEKPEAFQQLHSAYKQALELAETGVSRRRLHMPETVMVEPVQDETATGTSAGEELKPVIPPVATIEDVALSKASADSSAVADPAQEHEREIAVSSDAVADSAAVAGEGDAAVNEDAARQLRIDEYHKVLEQLEQTLQDPLRINREDRWHFLAGSPYMLEDEYNWNLGLAVFERIAQYNRGAEDKGNKKYRTHITDNVLNYCDQLFGWSGCVEAYYERFDEALADTIFDRLQTDAGDRDPAMAIRGGGKLVRQKARVLHERLEQYFFGGLLGRALAVVLDIGLIHMVIGVLATAVIMKVTGQTESDSTIAGLLFSGVAYLLMSWLAECSQWQTTPGKWLLGYRVMDREFQRVGYLRGLWRTLSFLLTVPTFKVGWFINCFLGGNLLHDRMSRTYVVNLRKSREEYLRRQA